MQKAQSDIRTTGSSWQDVAAFAWAGSSQGPIPEAVTYKYQPLTSAAPAQYQFTLKAATRAVTVVTVTPGLWAVKIQ